ncbi:MAG TPA: ribosome maturation factor RimP [Acidimicrobiales bacterium]
MGQARRAHELIESVLSTSGLELVDVQIGGGLVRVAVDRPGGVDLDALSEANRAISTALDREDPIPGGRYTLEVTSPGVERPLRTPEQFLRFVGTEVSVKTRPGTDGERRVAGRLAHADGSGVVITGADLPDEGRRLAYADIERARTIFQWGPADPGRGGRQGARRAPHRPSPPSTKKATTS